jgi:hypothetical protein
MLAARPSPAMKQSQSATATLGWSGERGRRSCGSKSCDTNTAPAGLSLAEDHQPTQSIELPAAVTQEPGESDQARPSAQVPESAPALSPLKDPRLRLCRACNLLLPASYPKARKHYHPDCRPNQSVNATSAQRESDSVALKRKREDTQPDEREDGDQRPLQETDSRKRLCLDCHERLPSSFIKAGKRLHVGCTRPPPAALPPDSSSTRDAAPASSHAFVTPSQHRPRARKPWDQVGHSTKAARKRSVLEFANSIHMPLSELHPAVPAAALMHLAGHTRKKMRTVPGLKISSEYKISRLEEAIAITHGTATAQFKLGTHITDPRKLIRTVNISGRPLVIICDFGGGSTKLGVTYFDTKGTAHFVALVISEAKDNWVGLNSLKTPGVLRFVGESARYSNIWAVLQDLIDTDPRTCLAGDWNSVSAIIGHKGAAANFPCPICTIPKEDLDKMAPYRQQHDKQSIDRPPLLRIDSRNIVPLPLHVYLGIGNRLADIGLTTELGKTAVTALVAGTKTKHTPSKGGLADYHGMNGRELKRFASRATAVLTPADTTPASAASGSPSSGDSDVATMIDWLNRLSGSLLTGGWLNLDQITALRTLFDEINIDWHAVTGDKHFPKLHMRFRSLRSSRITPPSTRSYTR